ncbi:hypothetical protein ACWOAH_09895 [Vagococcus vulneris]|uniref:Uncharacterized protein n=1 Tax=Vagococcus vulneris TaxID=1977869 RepID=A0A429ZWU0_9ENTE|nr:hypothetical protein CBF37_08150 [Vagococcus vulneris]
MDFHSFYQDVIKWMEANNQMVGQHTNQSDTYWEWVIQSIGYMCQKYDNHPLVISQMLMFLNYLEDSYLVVIKK